MNPKHVMVRLDPKTGNVWLTEERFRKPIKRIADITGHVLNALASDIVVEDGTQSTSRDVKFADGHRIRITVEHLPHEEASTGEPRSSDLPASESNLARHLGESAGSGGGGILLPSGERNIAHR